MKRKATEISIAHTNFDLKGFPYLEFHLNKMLLTIIIQKQIITKIVAITSIIIIYFKFLLPYSFKYEYLSQRACFCSFVIFSSRLRKRSE